MKKLLSILLAVILSVNLLAGMFLTVSASEESKAPGIVETIPETQEPTEPEADIVPHAAYPTVPVDDF